MGQSSTDALFPASGETSVCGTECCKGSLQQSVQRMCCAGSSGSMPSMLEMAGVEAAVAAVAACRAQGADPCGICMCTRSMHADGMHREATMQQLQHVEDGEASSQWFVLEACCLYTCFFWMVRVEATMAAVAACQAQGADPCGVCMCTRSMHVDGMHREATMQQLQHVEDREANS